MAEESLPETDAGASGRHAHWIALYVGLLVMASFLPDVTRLGFHEDDWSFVGRLVNSPSRSVPSLPIPPLLILLAAIPGRRVRPFAWRIVSAAISLATLAVIVVLKLRTLNPDRRVAEGFASMLRENVSVALSRGFDPNASGFN